MGKMLGGSGAVIQMMQHQTDSVTIIATPISGTKYEWRTGESGAGAALGTQTNIRIISIEAHLTWAVTQPTPLEAHVTPKNGDLMIFTRANPITGTNYWASIKAENPMGTQNLDDADEGQRRAFLMELRSGKVEVEITWATTQPTNLTMRIKWAKIT